MRYQTATARLAEFVLDTPTSSLPPPVLAAAGRATIDMLGCALGGIDEPVSDITRRWTGDAGERRSATVWGSRRRVEPAEAAFLNGVSGHALDFDDNLPSQRGHPSTTVLPAALVAAELEDRCGRDLLAAYALALEVSGKVGRAVGQGHYMRGFHATATVGIFGATAAAGRLLGLSPDQLAQAWGLAASLSSGLLANFGTMAKPFHAGHAARGALTAALYARDGFTAHPAIFDAERGFVAVYQGAGATGLDAQLGRLGQPWDVLDPGVFVKRWPCCLCSHRPIAGLLELAREHAIAPDAIQEIEIGFPPGTDAGLLPDLPETGLAGKFSVEYSATVALLDGDLVLSSFANEVLGRADVQGLMRKVRRRALPDAPPGSASIGTNEVAITTGDGTVHKHVADLPGSPAMPLSTGELDAKFIGCAEPVLGLAGARRALALVHELPDARRCSDLLAALVPAG